MRSLTLIVLLTSFFSCSEKDHQKRLIAEFEPTEYIWLQWDEGSYMNSAPIEDNFLQLIKAITPHTKMRILVHNLNKVDAIKEKMTGYNIDTSKIEFLEGKGQGAITDTAPVFLELGNGAMEQLILAGTIMVYEKLDILKQYLLILSTYMLQKS